MQKLFSSLLPVLFITYATALKSGSYTYSGDGTAGMSTSGQSVACCLPSNPLNYTKSGSTYNVKFEWAASPSCTSNGFSGSVDQTIATGSSMKFDFTSSTGVIRHLLLTGDDDNYLSKTQRTKIVMTGDSGEYCYVDAIGSGSLVRVASVMTSMLALLYLIF